MSVPEEKVRPAAFLLDLYGTLVDIHTDENQPSLWERMAGFVLSRGADWSARALHRAYLEAVHEEEERLRLRDRGSPMPTGRSTWRRSLPGFTRKRASSRTMR